MGGIEIFKAVLADKSKAEVEATRDALINALDVCKPGSDTAQAVIALIVAAAEVAAAK